MYNAIPLTKVIAAGQNCSIEGVVEGNGKCHAEEFLATECVAIRRKGKDKPESTAQAKFMAIFQGFANHGGMAKHFSIEMDGLYAFKAEVRNLQIRFPCFQDGRKWIVTHGFIKPGAKKKKGAWPKSQIERALRLREAYFARKQPTPTQPERNTS